MGDVAALRAGIDREWLLAAFRRDPISHAYGLWDLDHEPLRARFVSYGTSRETLAYLIVWSAEPGSTTVHWVGAGRGAEALLAAFPRRPVVAIVPEEMEALVRERLGPAKAVPLLCLSPASGHRAPPPEGGLDVREVGPASAAALRSWAAGESEPFARAYREFDPRQHRAWAAFEGDRVVGAATAGVRLPSIWVLNGIVVSPPARGRGYGRALTAALMAAAEATGARSALYVREDNGPARRVYDRLGFRPVGRLAWIDAGAPLGPSPSSGSGL